ncbi:MAG: AMP-binding protein, partial [Chloroflexi bacterium]|nr:AMP-binding protein [Chloroflexota bacterium]
MNLATLAEDNVLKFGEFEYLHYEGRWYTNVEMNCIANRLGNALKKLGVTRGDRVGTQVYNCPQVLQAFQAVLKIGAVIVPMNPSARGEEAAHLYRDSGIKVLITSSDYIPVIDSARKSAPDLATIILIDKDKVPGTLYFDKITADCPDQLAVEEMENDDNAAMIYTAGTTGLAKGVVHSHFGLYYTLLGFVETLETIIPARVKANTTVKNVNTGEIMVKDIDVVGLELSNVCLLVLPLCHIYGMMQMFLKYYLGDKLVILKRFDPVEVFKTMEEFKVSSLDGVPTMWVMLYNHPDIDKYDLSHQKYCSCGGAPMPLELLKAWKEKFGIQISEGWGMSELASYATSCFGRAYKPGSVGKLMQKASQIKIFDDNDREVPTGQWGEVVFKGFNVMKGYWNLPEETAKTIRNGWLYTGDIGYLDDEGYLFLTGRKKDLIIRGGENIFPSDVENILYKNAKVMECAVIGVPDRVYGEEIKAFVVLKPGESATEQELVDFCKQHLPSFKQPKSVELRESLPKSSVGKILKKELRNLFKK